MLCRACLSDITNGFKIFEECDKNHTLAAILNQYTSLVIEENDDLPNLFCTTCAETLIKFHNFVLTYKESIKSLNNLLLNINFVCDKSEVHEISVDNALSSDKPPGLIIDVNHQILRNNDSSGTEISLKKCESSAEVPKDDTTLLKMNEKTNICNICEEEFTSMRLLKKHYKLHESSSLKKQFICHVCGRRCNKMQDLKDHLESHSSESKYQCPICGKKLKTRSTFSCHLKSHNAEYVCELCGRVFNYRNTLRNHMNLVHFKTKQFACHICTQSFTLKATLDRHTRRHCVTRDRKRNFKCELCETSYLDQSSLTRHVNIKHENTDKFRCDLCKAEFTCKSSLVKHQTVFHIKGEAVK